jgi:hypothetical protein
MKDLETRVATWVEAGLITEEQARAILAAERSREPAPSGAPGPEPSRAATALGYLGASVALVGGIVAASQRWSEMGTGSRLALVGGATLLLLATGWLARRGDCPALRSLDGFLWFLAAGGAAFTAGLAGHELLELETRTVLMAAGLAMTAIGIPLWRIRPGALQEIAVAAGLALLVETLLHHLPGPPGALHGLPLWGLGAVWALLAWGGPVGDRRSSFVLAGVALLLGAQILSFGWRDAGLAVGIATAVLCLAASVRLQSMLPLGFGAAGVLLFLPQIVFEYLGDSLGAPLALLVCGVILLGAAFLVARLRGTVRRTPAPMGDAAAVGRRRRAALAAAGTALAIAGVVWAFGVAPLPDYPSLATRPDPSIPGRVAFLAGQFPRTCLYVGPAGGGDRRRLRCVDPGKDGADWLLGAPIGWTREGRIVLQVIGESSLRALVLDPANGRVLERISAGGPIVRSAMEPGVDGPGGARLLVQRSHGAATLGIAPPDGSPREVARVSGPPGYAFREATWSPDGEWVLVRDSNQNLLVVRAREGAAPRLLAEQVWGPFAWHIPGVVAGTVDLDSLRAAR